MTNFVYFEPDNLKEAIALLNEHVPTVKVVAGGTDLIVEHLHHLPVPENIIGITNIPELNGIRIEADHLHIGSTTNLHQISRSEKIIQHWRMLAESAAIVGSRQIRNLATIGGNICNAVPSADTAPPLLASDAEVIIEGHQGKRQATISEFFVGVRKTILEPDEIVVEFRLPIPRHRTGTAYLRHTPRKALDLAMVGVAARITLDDNSTIRNARIALGAVAPTPIRVYAAEEILIGNNFTGELLDEVAELAADASKPISDVRGSIEFRLSMVKELSRRSMSLAFERANEVAQ